MNIPENLKYTKSHEWVLFSGETKAKVGITDFAQEALGDIVFLSLPQQGDAVTAGESMGEVESVKAVSDVNCPVSGVVADVNTALDDAPEKINEDPYGSWLIEVSDIGDTSELLDAAAYKKVCEEEQ